MEPIRYGGASWTRARRANGSEIGTAYISESYPNTTLYRRGNTSRFQSYVDGEPYDNVENKGPVPNYPDWTMYTYKNSGLFGKSVNIYCRADASPNKGKETCQTEAGFKQWSAEWKNRRNNSAPVAFSNPLAHVPAASQPMSAVGVNPLYAALRQTKSGGGRTRRRSFKKRKATTHRVKHLKRNRHI